MSIVTLLNVGLTMSACEVAFVVIFGTALPLTTSQFELPRLETSVFTFVEAASPPFECPKAFPTLL